MNNQQIQCHKITRGGPSNKTYNLDIEASKKLSRMTLQLCFVFVRHCKVFLLRHNYVICWFYIFTFFADVRITLYFGTFKLSMEITLQLRFVFARHCNVFFYVTITLFVCSI